MSLELELELFRGVQTSEEWKAYVEYIDNMVIDGFFKIIKCSLRFFLDNTGRMLMRLMPNQRETLVLFNIGTLFFYHYNECYICKSSL